jgi:hypothetical protein
VTLGNADGAREMLDLVGWARAIEDVARDIQHSGVDC